jgi:hypothetical protein
LRVWQAADARLALELVSASQLAQLAWLRELELVSGARLAQSTWLRVLELVLRAPLAQQAWVLALAQERARVPALVAGDWAAQPVPALAWPQQVARELLQRSVCLAEWASLPRTRPDGRGWRRRTAEGSSPLAAVPAPAWSSEGCASHEWPRVLPAQAGE